MHLTESTQKACHEKTTLFQVQTIGKFQFIFKKNMTLFNRNLKKIKNKSTLCGWQKRNIMLLCSSTNQFADMLDDAILLVSQCKHERHYIIFISSDFEFRILCTRHSPYKIWAFEIIDIKRTLTINRKNRIIWHVKTILNGFNRKKVLKIGISCTG